VHGSHLGVRTAVGEVDLQLPAYAPYMIGCR